MKERINSVFPPGALDFHEPETRFGKWFLPALKVTVLAYFAFKVFRALVG